MCLLLQQCHLGNVIIGCQFPVEIILQKSLYVLGPFGDLCHISNIICVLFVRYIKCMTACLRRAFVSIITVCVIEILIFCFLLLS